MVKAGKRGRFIVSGDDFNCSVACRTVAGATQRTALAPWQGARQLADVLRQGKNRAGAVPEGILLAAGWRRQPKRLCVGRKLGKLPGLPVAALQHAAPERDKRPVGASRINQNIVIV